MHERKPRLCFVSLYSYPLFNSENQTPFGGSEVRISLIAKEIAKRNNFDVSLVVWDHGQPPEEMREGVNIFAWVGEHCSLPVTAPSKNGNAVGLNEKVRKWLKNHLPQEFRSFLHFLYGIPRGIYHFFTDNPLLMLGYIGHHPVRRRKFKVFDRINADIYLMHGNSETAAELAFYCAKKSKKYIFLAGSDADYHPGYKEKPKERGVYGYGYLMCSTIQNASAHIVQNEKQAGLLKEVYGLSSHVIPNPVDLNPIKWPNSTSVIDCLWVGKSDWIKRPEICIELARQFPEHQFTMIMSYSNLQIHHQIVEAAEKMTNITIYHYVPFYEIEQFFEKARLFINTSVLEGFPNTFLQAAKYGVPILALDVDPNGMLSQHNCGFTCGGNLQNMVKAINLLMNDQDVYTQKSKNCKDYLKTYHDKEILIPQFEKIFMDILGLH